MEVVTLVQTHWTFSIILGVISRSGESSRNQTAARVLIWSKATAEIKTTPRVISLQKLDTSRRVRPLFSVPRMRTARTVPQTDPRPPYRLVPPRMIAAITVKRLDPAQAKIVGSPGEFAWGGMASTAFWVNPVEEMTVILMTQLIPSSAYTLRRQLRVLCYQALA